MHGTSLLSALHSSCFTEPSSLKVWVAQMLQPMVALGVKLGLAICRNRECKSVCKQLWDLWSCAACRLMQLGVGP